MAQPVWSRFWLEHAAGRHIASEEHVRIQVLDVKPGQREPTQILRGNLLINVLRGKCLVRVNSSQEVLGEGDQWLIEKGDIIAIMRASQDEEVAAQLIWMPGISLPEGTESIARE